ncbi:MAG: SDR family oxidoreductase [Acidobacteria bacterium]|nr:SDR family oxidoreductase [Acidobacteriota bacterium]
MKRVAVTGAGRGLGLEFASQWLAAGCEVFALARDPGASKGLTSLGRDFPGRLHGVVCDVSDDASVASAAATVGGMTDALDMIVNNAAMAGTRGGSLAELDLDEVRRVFDVNSLGPIRVSRALLPFLKRGASPKLVHISSLMGSITDNRSGGTWSYRISKAALNMVAKLLALELSRDGVVSAAFHPGWVRTDMGGASATLGIAESVAALIRTIEALTPEQSGAILDRHGQPLPL